MFHISWVCMVAILRTESYHPAFCTPCVLFELFLAMVAYKIQPVFLMNFAMSRSGKKFKIFNVIVMLYPIFMMKIRVGRVWLTVLKPPNNVRPKCISVRIGSRTIWSVNPKPSIFIHIPQVPIFWRPQLISS